MSITDRVAVQVSAAGAPETVAQLLAVKSAMQSVSGTPVAMKVDTAAIKTASADVNTLGQNFRTAGTAAQAFEGNVRGAATSAAAMGGAAVGVAAVAAAFVIATKEAATYQQQVANLQAVLHASPTDLSNLSASIQLNSRETVFTATQIVEADRQLAKAGQDANQIIAEQRDLLNLASASQSSAADAATAYVTALKDFNLTSRESVTISDDLAKAVDSSVGTLADMQDALKQVGPVAAQAGLDLKQTTVAIAGLENAGLQGDSGTALKIFLQRLEAPTAAAKKALADLGIEAYDAAGNMKSLMDIADQLQARTAGLSDEQKNLDLTKIFGQRGVRVADIFATQGAAGMQEVIDHENQIGSAAEIAATKLDTLSGQMHQLSSSANVVAVNLGTLALPAIKSVTTELTGLINLAGLATARLGTGKFTSGFVDQYGAGATITGTPAGDVNAQADRVKQLTQELHDAQNSFSMGADQFMRQVLPGFGLFAGVVGDQDMARVAFLKQQLADAQKIAENIGQQSESAKSLAASTLQQNIGTIINDQVSRDARLSNAPDSLDQIAKHAQDAKGYIDSFQQAFITSGHTIQEWQTLERNAFQDIDKNAKTAAENAKTVEEQNIQTVLDLNARKQALLNQGAPESLVARAVFGEIMGLSADEIVKAKNELKGWETQQAISAKGAADQIGVMNKALDSTDKALLSIKQNKGVDGLLTALGSLTAAQTELSQIGVDNAGLDDIVAMGQAFQSLADQETAAASQFDGFMAASAHTDTYIKKIDDTKKHYADLETYVKEKPLAARTDADIQFLDQYNQRLATMNNEEDQLKERQVVDANNASAVIPNFAFDDAQYRDLVKQYGGEIGLKVRLDVDVQQAAEAASKASYLLDQITNHPYTVTLALSGNQVAEDALARIEKGESAAAEKADIVIVAKALGITDIQTLADLIAGIHDKAVNVSATVTTAYTSTGTLPTPGTVPGIVIGKPYATGGAVSGDMAIVGDTPSGDMSAAEVVDFRTRRVYAHADAVARGWLGSAMPRYAGGTIDANDPNAVQGPYTADHPGPSSDLSTAATASAAVRTNLTGAATAAQHLDTAATTVDHTLVDMTTQANVLAGYLTQMAAGSVTEVTRQFDQQYALLSKIAQAALPKNATAEQTNAANSAAAVQAMDVTIAMARALQDATVPSNDLAADFQKIRDTGTPIADNLIRQVSITRELNIANAAILADQAAMTALDDAHSAAQAQRTADDRAASRAKTEEGWQTQSADQAIAEAQRVAQYQWTLDAERRDARKTDTERAYQDAVTAEDRGHQLATRNLDDQLKAMEKLQQTADAGNSALEVTYATAAKGPGDLATKFGAAELLAIQKDFDSRNRQTLADQVAAIKDAQVAETRLYEDDKYHRDLTHTIATRNYEDEATAAANNHARVQEQWAQEAAQRQQIAFAQQVADTRHQWQVEDTRLAVDAQYTSAKDALTDQTKRDQDHAKALQTELTNAQTVEGLWEKLYPLAGDTAKVLLTAFSQITGEPVTTVTVPGHAAGGTITTPYALVGEQGPELIRAPGYTVTPAGETRALRSGTGGPTHLHMHFAAGASLSDADLADIKAYVDRKIAMTEPAPPAGNYGFARGSAA